MHLGIMTERDRALGGGSSPDDRGSLLRTDDGYVLVLVALLLVPLLIMTAFAVDIGAWYAQGTKMQRAVDHAALAGVVWMPDDEEAERVANAVVLLNGFDDPVDVDWPNDWQMEVSLSRPATRYFSGIIMTGDQVLTRSAIAAYNKPIPLGSPGKVLGNEVATGVDTPRCPNFNPRDCAVPISGVWLNAPGPYVNIAAADPYTTFCPFDSWALYFGLAFNKQYCGTLGEPGLPPQNPEYHYDGKAFAIDVPKEGRGLDITVEVWDAARIRRMPSDCPSGPALPQCQTGDAGLPDRNSLDIQFEMFDNDGSDATVAYNATLTGTSGQPCEMFIPRGTPSGEPPTLADASTVAFYKNKWRPVCTFTPTTAGIYPLRVKTSNITRPDGTFIVPSDDLYDPVWGQERNNFALRITTSSQSTLYSLDDLSIFPNPTTAWPRFYIANIGPQHKGKTILVDVYDAGDARPEDTKTTLKLLAPPTAEPFNVPLTGEPLKRPEWGTPIPDGTLATSCRSNPVGSPVRGGGAMEPLADCTAITSDTDNGLYDGIYEGSWLRYEVQLGSDYSCGPDCWWTFLYDFGLDPVTGNPLGASDPMVVMISVVGDPVRLVR